MVYTQKEKRKMDDVLEAFAEYTAKHPDFDVVYSDKSGYVRLVTAENSDNCYFKIKGFKQLLDMFCMEIVAEDVDREFKKNRDINNCDIDYDKIRYHIQTYLNRLEEGNQEEAEKIVNRYIIRAASSPYLP